MASKVSRQIPEAFDRTPYIFERKKLDEYGEEIVESFYSVAGRKEEFHYLYPEGRFIPEVVELRPNFAVFKCRVYLDAAAETPFAVAHASRELESSTEIGRRFIECAETASIGRALANAGIGADALLDELDLSEREELGGTPINRRPATDQPVPEPKKESQADPAPDDKAAKTSKAPKAAAQEDSPSEEAPMGDDELLKTVITTTESKSLKGKTFVNAMALAKDTKKFYAFLETLVDQGTDNEKRAAKLLLSRMPKEDA